MKKILIGTTNAGKVNDFKQLFKKENNTIISLLDLPNALDVEETGRTFAENARLKAETLSQYYNEIVIADDSGLEVEALNGDPGVFSARYAGEQKNDEENIKKLLLEMEGIPFHARKAAFVCVLALAIPGRETMLFEGRCSGYIAETPKGKHGFGYDPVFYVPEKNKTMAELSIEEKNEVSHRRKALDKLKRYWEQEVSTLL